MTYTWRHVRQCIKMANSLGYRVEFRCDVHVNHDHKLLSMSKLDRNMETTVYGLLHEMGHILDLESTLTDMLELEKRAWLLGTALHEILFKRPVTARYHRHARLWLAYYE